MLLILDRGLTYVDNWPTVTIARWQLDAEPEDEEDVVLEMRMRCERCNRDLAVDGAAVICSFECTFCVDCSESLQSRCPNCGGELVARPRRQT
jgi:hypothetical protein